MVDGNLNAFSIDPKSTAFDTERQKNWASGLQQNHGRSGGHQRADLIQAISLNLQVRNQLMQYF